MIVIGIDPGKTTGVCIVETQPGGFDITLATEVSWDRRFDLGDDIIAQYGDNQAEVFVVMESFNLYPASARSQAAIRSSFPSVEIIGIVTYACHLNGIQWIQQPPSTRSRVLILEQHREALRGKVHAKDAYKHIRYFLVHLKQLNKSRT